MQLMAGTMTNTAAESTPTNPPFGGLPSADRTLLARPPLELAIVEVRFTPTFDEIAPETASQLRDELSAATDLDFPTIEPAVQQQFQINFNAQGGAPKQQVELVSRGWQIAAAGGAVLVTLMPDSFIVQVSQYERWSVSLKAPLSALLEGVVTHLRPSLVQRIGLRYVDRFRDDRCKTVRDWTDKISDSLLGPVLNDVFGDNVRAAQQQVELALDSKHGALLRHGPAPDPSTQSINYLLDIDVFELATSAFRADEILNAAERLNRTSLSLFQACMRPTYLRSLQDEETLS